MSGHPLARPSAWRLWWSFTWRQAAAMMVSLVVLSIFFSLLKWLGMPTGFYWATMPYLTFGIMVYSTYEACRRLAIVYDIRLRGAHSDEQDHRHRR